MDPLNARLVAKKYQQIFSIPSGEAEKMADIVKGYPYAYQVLGYLCYKRQCSYEEVIDEFDAYLGEYVYDKIWSEMSEKDRKAAKATADSLTGKISEIRALSDMSSEEFAVYRNRLLKKGIVISERYGYLQFVLPRFAEYINGIHLY